MKCFEIIKMSYFDCCCFFTYCELHFHRTKTYLKEKHIYTKLVQKKLTQMRVNMKPKLKTDSSKKKCKTGHLPPFTSCENHHGNSNIKIKVLRIKDEKKKLNKIKIKIKIKVHGSVSHKIQQINVYMFINLHREFL